MHSSWQLWDFFRSNTSNWTDLKPKVCLAAFDDLSLFLLREHLVKSIDQSVQLKTLLGSDITYDWFFEEFCSLSFFQDQTSYIILSPDDLNVKIKELVLSSSFQLDQKKLALAFSKESPFQKKWSAVQDVEVIKIDAPKFWETAKVVDFCAAHLALPLNYEAKVYVLESMEPNFSDIYRQLQQIKLLYFSEKTITKEQVQEVFGNDYLDQFKLATEFGKKKFPFFFEKVISLSLDFDRLRSFFAFMQTHLLKFADTSYLKDKPRLTNYDKEIQTLAKIWTPAELEAAISFFHDIEIECKKKKPQVLNNLRSIYLLTLWKKMGPQNWRVSKS